MKKIIKTLFVFILSMAIYNAVSAASLTISPINKTVKTGETVELSAGVVDAAGWDIKVTTSGGTLTGNVEDADSSGTQTSKTVLTPTFTANTAGTYTITVSGELTYDDPNSDLGISKKPASATATITVEAPVVEPPVKEEPKEDTPTETPKEETPTEQPKEETPVETPKEDTPAETPKEETPKEEPKDEPKEEPKEEPKQEPEEPVLSSNNKLKMLGIKPNDFRNFKSGTTTYYITVPNEVSEVEVYAEKQEDAQEISGTGMVDLDVGKNTVRVVCTAENGTTKTYTMYITREEEKIEEPEVVEEPEEEPTTKEEEPQEEPETFEEKILGITNLNILAKTEDGKDVQVELNPIFDEKTSEYAVAIPLTVKDIDVSVEAGTQKAEIELMGNKNLVEGKNIVTAIVKIGDQTKVYQITVNKIEMVETSALSNELIMQLAVIAGIATAIIVAIVGIIVAIVTSKKKGKKQEPVNYKNTEISTQQTNVEQTKSEEPKKEE